VPKFIKSSQRVVYSQIDEIAILANIFLFLLRRMHSSHLACYLYILYQADAFWPKDIAFGGSTEVGK
jgi:hypothetical protein